MSYVHAKIAGELLTYPQTSNEGLDGRHYVLVRPKRDEKAPEWILKNRKFQWTEGGGYSAATKSSELRDDVGDYCVYGLNPVELLGGCQPGDQIEVDVKIFPVCVARQGYDDRRRPTADIHLTKIPTMYFCADGSIRKAAPSPKSVK
jgi:hypothetical protein